MTRADKRARRFVHLGDRLQAIARIRAGTSDAGSVADELGVAPEDVAHWLEVHREERNVTLEELRSQDSPEVAKLRRRAARLADLVAQAERMLRGLHQELTSKQFVENPHLRALRVVHAQPRGD
jgi:hypothetical protein